MFRKTAFEMRQRLIFAFGVVFAAMMISPVFAGEAEDKGDVGILIDGLSAATIKKLRANPKKYIDETAAFIVGYGHDGSIGAEEISFVLRVQRSKIRVREMRRLLLADLDGDARIGLTELNALIETVSASSRGRLAVAFMKADANEDSAVDMEELYAYGERLAAAELTERNDQKLWELLAFDRDGDGRVALSEVLEALREAGLEA